MKTIRVFTVLLLVFFAVPCIVMALDWHIETVDSVGMESSIALDSTNNPHISYRDDTNSDLKYAYYDGSSWHIETVDSTGDVGWNPSIALDSFDNPHISYRDDTNSDLKYAYYDGSSWHIEKVDSTGDVGLYNSMALDSSDYPHISYHDDTNSDLKYVYYDGSWHTETVQSAGNVGTSTSIALDSSDNPHISYKDSYPNYDLKYAYYDGSSWHIETVDSTGDVGTSTSIALDSSDNPHISYFDSTNFDLKYAYYNGTWHIETVDTEDVGAPHSIALDSSDNPHISYFDLTNFNLKYAYYYGTWHIETVDTGSAGNPSIALDSSDNPHISYFDSTNFDLKYAYAYVNEWLSSTYEQMFGHKNSLVALPVFRGYRDKILMNDRQGKELVSELYSEHSSELASIVNYHPKLARRSGALLMRNLFGICRVLAGKKMKINSSQLIEVKKLLDDVAELGSPELKEYIHSVKQILQKGNLENFGVIVEDDGKDNKRFVQKPKETHLLQNKPNPFNPDTWIPYQLAKPADVIIRIYSLAGQLVRTLNLGHKEAGKYISKDQAVYWDGRNEEGVQVASGVYFYHFKTADFNAVRKMVLKK